MTALLLLIASPLSAGENPPSPPSLSEMASKSDVVALVQVRDTDYLRRRGIPVSGSAHLRVLLGYKMDVPAEWIEVYDKGLHEGECYFPDPGVYEEGRRYLVFLTRDSENTDRYRGQPEGCALDVLVTTDNRYALRYPVTGIALSDPLGELVTAMTFGDAYAVVTAEDLPAEQRDSLLSDGLIRPYREGGWIYTSGISLPDVRRRIGPAALE